jgi:DTW domain-containing protein YfiP
VSTRCLRCRLRQCLCHEIPRVQTRTEIVIVRHAAERTKPSNTAHLATLALPRSQLVEYGVLQAQLDQTRLVAGNTWVLFPDGEEAPPATPPPQRLIVLDGTWSQARRMRQRIAALRGLPLLRLPAPAAPRLRLRRPHHPAGMSTLEAIAAAIALLEGRDRAAPLEQLHDLFVAAWIRESTRIVDTPDRS